jgi:hypothetical protein
MVKRATVVSLSPEVERTLRLWIQEAEGRALIAERAKIVLLAAEQCSTQQIARTLGIRPARVSKWRMRFAAYGIGGLETAERSGKPRSYDDSVDARILSLVDQAPPEPHAVWTGPLLASAVGNVSVDYVWRVLRTNRVSLRRRDQSECVTTTSVVRKPLSTFGFYLSPRVCALVFGIAAPGTAPHLDRLWTYVRLPNPASVADLKRHVGAGSQPTILQALQWAASRPHAVHDARTLDAFLYDARINSGARQIQAFIVGGTPPDDREIRFRVLPNLAAWKELLAFALSITLEEADKDTLLVSNILAASEQFLSAQRFAPTAAFEWHAWSAVTRKRAEHQNGEE